MQRALHKRIERHDSGFEGERSIVRKAALYSSFTVNFQGQETSFTKTNY